MDIIGKLIPDKAKRNWFSRLGVLLIGVFCFCSVTIGTIALYAHYGPLTPNGNRYYHDFDMGSVVWGLVVLEMIAMASLVYPSIRYGLSSNDELRLWGIFPARNKVAGCISLLLSILCIGSQVIYALYYSLTVLEYLSNHSRVMAEDLETMVQFFAYFLCIGFWGVINTIYSVYFKLKW